MYYVSKSQGNVSISLIRHHGSIGEVSVNLQYINMTAKSGLNYVGGVGLVKFGHDENHNELKIPILQLGGGEEGDILFEMKLYDPEGGAKVKNIIQTKISE